MRILIAQKIERLTFQGASLRTSDSIGPTVHQDAPCKMILYFTGDGIRQATLRVSDVLAADRWTLHFSFHSQRQTMQTDEASGVFLTVAFVLSVHRRDGFVVEAVR